MGRLLVAAKSLRDPNFVETVILLVNYGRSGSMGLVLNRRSGATISGLMESVAKKANGRDPVYAGGPVSRRGVLALVKADSKPGDASLVVEHVYLVSSPEELEKRITTGSRGDTMRAYAGYAGWAPGQLESELESGAWHVFNGSAAVAFDPDPESLWKRLIKRTELRYARR